MIQSKRDYSRGIATLCRQHNVGYLGLRGSSYEQENIGTRDPEICFLVEFFPMELKEYARCYFGLKKELENLFGREVILFGLGDKMPPEFQERIKRNKNDICKASESSA